MRWGVADGAPTQVVSDTRRLSDLEWFRDVYGDVVQTVRVVATEETRKRRNWVFVAGEQDSTVPGPGLCWRRSCPTAVAPLPLPPPGRRSWRRGVKPRLWGLRLWRGTGGS